MVDTFAPAKKPVIANSQLDLTARNQKVQYGDGYDQTAPDGINNITRKIPLTWASLSQAESDYIESFFIAKAGSTPFYYKAPMDSVTRLWKAPTFSKVPVTGNLFSVVLNLEESFNPV